MQALLQAAGKKVSAIEIRKLIEEVDAVENGGNGDGLISESEFLRMLRDNKGPNIFAEATRMRANQVNQRRLELEAAKRSKTENKLESDKQKQVRKNLQLAEEAERLRLANDDKARQVAEYNQREYENTTNEKERVRREDMERQALVKKRQDDKQAELNEAGRIKQAALEEAERLRIQNKKGKYSKRRANVAVIHVRIVFIGSFLFYCLLLNHSFQTNPNSITNCFKLFSLLQLYNYIAPASLF